MTDLSDAARDRRRLFQRRDAFTLVLERRAETAPATLFALGRRRGRASRSGAGQGDLIAALVGPEERPFAHRKIAAGRTGDEVANVVDDLFAREDGAGATEGICVEGRDAQVIDAAARRIQLEPGRKCRLQTCRI